MFSGHNSYIRADTAAAENGELKIYCSVVVDWYYRRRISTGKMILHYTKFVGNTPLHTKLVYMCSELIRLFYDATRPFRVEDREGMMRFIQYSNERLLEQALPAAYEGAEQAYRVPILDIRVQSAKI